MCRSCSSRTNRSCFSCCSTNTISPGTSISGCLVAFPSEGIWCWCSIPFSTKAFSGDLMSFVRLPVQSRQRSFGSILLPSRCRHRGDLHLLHHWAHLTNHNARTGTAAHSALAVGVGTLGTATWHVGHRISYRVECRQSYRCTGPRV